ncbi:lipopolysaccharide biosynthesis protein [Prevotella sp. OH937_COT-195]|uniref:lipopolysaccharide biosynthesis protein n=1 Tax=Prevotella sp. OH937_COT-195 TaxID=2491051 RepID=UPI000F6556C7|nr:lipopolysaccharide biosynthesis protein [Prevotella sp. OH937_COT-195]RRD02516.1 lipopolysaccharide biosynthesis protein [Prevotella sp. OH937_COT-195]
METLKDKTAKGLFWGAMNNSVQQLLGFLFGIVTLRLLSPQDNGMMAIIAIFSQVATVLQDSGFRSALVNIKAPSHRDYNAVFWFNIIVGVTMYLVLFFTAPLIAAYYHTPELTWFSRYAFLSIILASFNTAQSAWLFKNLCAKQQAKAAMTAVLLSGIVCIVMAWQGFAYWSLATQGLVFMGGYMLMNWHYSPWRPTFHFDFRPIRGMFRFSVKMLVTTVVERVNVNIMNILLGRYFSKHDVGIYNTAYNWSQKGASLVQGMVAQVAQPVFSGLQDDRERQLRVLRKMMRFTSFVSFPLMFGLSLVSEEVIVVAITAKWLDSAMLLRILSISAAFSPLSTVLSQYIVSRGRSGIYLGCTSALCVLLAGMMILLHGEGIGVMVWAYTVLFVAWFFVWHHFVSRLAGYRFIDMLADVVPFLVASVCIMLLTGWATSSVDTLWLRLVLRFTISASLYFALMKMLRVKILDECIEFVMRKIRK